MAYEGVVTKLRSVEPEHQALIHKEVLAASKEGLNVSVRYDDDYFMGYTVFTMTDDELENYYSAGGQWTYVSAREFLANSSSFAY